MKSLYACGCSFTQGDGVEHCKEEASFLVGKKLGCTHSHNADGTIQTYYNKSHSGGCNKFIRRKTINWLCENKKLWDDLIVLIGWTNPLRHEIYLSDFKNYNDLENTLGYLQIGSGARNPTKQQFDGLLDYDFYKQYMVNHYDITHQFDLHIDDVLMLQSFLKLNSIKYVMWNSLNDRWDKNLKDFVDEDKLSLIDSKHWVMDDTKYSWEEFLNDLDPPHGLEYRLGIRNDHPNELGHKLWADEIYKKIEELYGKEL